MGASLDVKPGRFIDSYEYPEPYAEQAALQRATVGPVRM